MGSERRRRSPVPSRAIGVAAVLASLLLLAPPAVAEPSAPGTSATVGGCLAAGEVWLHVQAGSGEVLRSECVGTPATGGEALRAAEVATGLARGGYICTMAGHPEDCPETFAGQYWQYRHAASAGAPWKDSERGADTYRPAPGSIEGWCYNAPDRDRCHLPTLTADHPAAERVDAAAGPTGPAASGAWVAAGFVLVLGAVALLVRSRRR